MQMKPKFSKQTRFATVAVLLLDFKERGMGVCVGRSCVPRGAAAGISTLWAVYAACRVSEHSSHAAWHSAVVHGFGSASGCGQHGRRGLVLRAGVVGRRRPARPFFVGGAASSCIRTSAGSVALGVVLVVALVVGAVVGMVVDLVVDLVRDLVVVARAD